MSRVAELSKRIRSRRTAPDRSREPLPRQTAVPVLSSVPLSAVAYATQEILVVLTLGALAYLYLLPWVAAAVVVLVAVVVASYRRIIHAYPGGGGSFSAAGNLGPYAAVSAGSAMLLGNVLLVAVAVAAAVDNLVAAFPALHDARVPVAAGIVAALAVLTMVTSRQYGVVAAVPAYLFVAAIAALVVTGLGQAAFGAAPVAESAGFAVRPELGDLSAAALVVLVLRAFSAGGVSAAGTGTITTAVPTFRKRRSASAAATLAGAAAASMLLFAGVTALAVIADVRYVRDPCDLAGFDCGADPQRTVIAQLGAAVFGDATAGFVAVQVATVLVLLVAASTAIAGFAPFASVLAARGYLARRLHHPGDRQASRIAVAALGLAAAGAVAAFGASVTALIQLYLVATFLSFTLGQLGMVRHWSRALAEPPHDRERPRAAASRALAAVGAVLTAVVAVTVAVTGFAAGAWVMVVAVPLLALLMWATKGHYDAVAAELAAPEDRAAGMLPSRVHAIVLVSRVHKPTLRALAYARTSRPDLLEAVTVSVDMAATRALTDEWDRRGIPVPLKVLDAPHREIAGPVLEYVKSIRRASPRDVVVVYVPEYAVGRWWERPLHNRSAVRLKRRLLLTPGVMVTTVPWQSESAHRRRGS